MIHLQGLFLFNYDVKCLHLFIKVMGMNVIG